MIVTGTSYLGMPRLVPQVLLDLVWVAASSLFVAVTRRWAWHPDLPALTVTGVHQLAAVRRRRVRRTQRCQSAKHTSTLLLSFERGVAAVVGGGGAGGVAMHPLSGTQPA